MEVNAHEAHVENERSSCQKGLVPYARQVQHIQCEIAGVDLV